LLVFALLIPFFGGCAAFHAERPRVSLVDVGLESVGLLQSSIAISLRVENPNGFRLPIERGVYTVFLGGERVGTGATTSPLSVPAYGTSTQVILVDFDNLRLLSRLRAVLDGRAVDYRVEAEHFLSGLGSRSFKSVAEGELELDSTATRR
jgi:LEA14-like dessication related protein